MKSIALTGKMRSGKDTVAAYLTQKYGYTRFAFGDELKRYYHELFGASDAKQREGYQWFGQTMRQRDPDIWVRKCFDAIDVKKAFHTSRYEKYGLATPPFNVVITDLRQPNEFERCKREGYAIVRVRAPGSVRIERARAAGDEFDEATLTHETESHIDGFDVDYELYNDGTLAFLYAQIDGMMEVLAS